MESDSGAESQHLRAAPHPTPNTSGSWAVTSSLGGTDQPGHSAGFLQIKDKKGGARYRLTCHHRSCKLSYLEKWRREEPTPSFHQ